MDINLVCRDCGAEFVFTEGEQKFFRRNNLYPPVRCRQCRDQKKAMKANRLTCQSEEGNYYIPGAPKMKSPSMYRAITWLNVLYPDLAAD